MAAAVASSVSSSETGVAADVELELSPLDDAIVAVCAASAAAGQGRFTRRRSLLNP